MNRKLSAKQFSTSCRLRALRNIFCAIGQACRLFLLLQLPTDYTGSECHPPRLERGMSIISAASASYILQTSGFDQACRFVLLLQRPTSYRLRALRIINPVTRQACKFFLSVAPANYILQTTGSEEHRPRHEASMQILSVASASYVLQTTGSEEHRPRHEACM